MPGTKCCKQQQLVIWLDCNSGDHSTGPAHAMHTQTHAHACPLVQTQHRCRHEFCSLDIPSSTVTPAVSLSRKSSSKISEGRSSALSVASRLRTDTSYWLHSGKIFKFLITLIKATVFNTFLFQMAAETLMETYDRR